MGRIRAIVLHTKAISASGWPALWSLEDVCLMSENDRRVWLQNAASFFSRTRYAQELDKLKIGSDGWIHSSFGLVQANVQARAKQEEFERHLYLRYVFTSLKCKQLPVEFLALPSGNVHRCSECREQDMRARAGAGMSEMFEEWDDLPDEFGSDDEY